MNYTMEVKKGRPQLTEANQIEPGDICVITEGAYESCHLLCVPSYNENKKQFHLLDNPTVWWSGNCSLEVRLLEPGEEIILKGK